MRILGLYGLLLVLVPGGMLCGQAPEDATAVAKGFVERVMNAWAARDGRAYTDQFWPDAETVNAFGGVINGHQVIAPRMEQVFKGGLSARNSKQTIRKVRMLAPNVIVVDTVNTDDGNAAGATTMFKYVLEKRAGVWRAVAGQNTRVSTPTF